MNLPLDIFEKCNLYRKGKDEGKGRPTKRDGGTVIGLKTYEGF